MSRKAIDDVLVKHVTLYRTPMFATVILFDPGKRDVEVLGVEKERVGMRRLVPIKCSEASHYKSDRFVIAHFNVPNTTHSGVIIVAPRDVRTDFHQVVYLKVNGKCYRIEGGGVYLFPEP